MTNTKQYASNSNSNNQLSAFDKRYFRNTFEKSITTGVKKRNLRNHMMRLDDDVAIALRIQYGLPAEPNDEEEEEILSETKVRANSSELVDVIRTVPSDLCIDGDMDDNTYDDTSDTTMGSSEDVSTQKVANPNAASGYDMSLMFLGTASCVPSVTRAVSCVAFRHVGDVWLFDAGEGTQLQLQRSQIKPSKITRIFITHAHGDHSFGLPGLLCLMGLDKKRDPVEIYGPEGLRNYLRATIRYTVSRIVPKYRVHELKGVPYFTRDQYNNIRNGFWQWPKTEHTSETMELDPRYGEIPGGRDIYPDENGIYKVDEGQEIIVEAGPMVHTIPCVGYVITEKPRPGKLKIDEVRPIVERNLEALKEGGMKDPNKLFRLFKSMSKAEEITLPDGTVVRGEDVNEPQQPGRKVVIAGDTSDCSGIRSIAENADVLVHEATNAYIKNHDRTKDYKDVEYSTTQHGHSTPEIAGEFAKSVKAKRLILTHFSPRYKGDDSPESSNVMKIIEKQGRKASGLDGNAVVAACDFMLVPIPIDRQQ